MKLEDLAEQQNGVRYMVCRIQGLSPSVFFAAAGVHRISVKSRDAFKNVSVDVAQVGPVQAEVKYNSMVIRELVFTVDTLANPTILNDIAMVIERAGGKMFDGNVRVHGDPNAKRTPPRKKT